MAPTVLLADDSDHARRMIGQYLTDLGCRVVTAVYGEAAWQALGRARPDLVMIDVRLPGISGREFRRRMRATPEWQATPVLLLAGALDADAEGGGEGAVLHKPLGAAAVAAALAGVFPGGRFPAPAAAAPPPPAPGPAPPDDAALLRRLLAMYFPPAQAAAVVRAWERRRREAGAGRAICDNKSSRHVS